MNSVERTPSNCDICGATQTLSVTIHNIRYRAHTRRYCTNCVLKQHPGLFCPLCFELYDDSFLPPHHRLMCVRCPSVAHRSCVFPSTNSSAAPAPPFFCPTCLDSNFTFFNLPHRKTGAVDLQSAKVLVTASRIAALSMTKAAAAARFDAETRAREAALARKRAKQALEDLAEILSREQADHLNGVVSAGRRRGAELCGEYGLLLLGMSDCALDVYQVVNLFSALHPTRKPLAVARLGMINTNLMLNLRLKFTKQLHCIRVQRCAEDEGVVMTTYEGNHNHPVPAAARSMACSTEILLLKAALEAAVSSIIGDSQSQNHCQLSGSECNPIVKSATLTCPPAKEINMYVTSRLAGLLHIELEEVKKENQNLRSMLNDITEHYAALQNQLLLVIQQKKLSSSPRNNEDRQANLT
ncbi:hypothetical protein VNO78_22899 [Psophocarpus tetragonolobus]|uniref:WRKY domain-containing protein n=1 Tax=Psophocarpus tetragonolobus TaxID=3891 RepID=A0AAN9XDY8_PSOTE